MLRFGGFPRHRPVRIRLTWRTRYDDRRIAELGAVQRENILYNMARTKRHWTVIGLMVEIEANDAPT